MKYYFLLVINLVLSYSCTNNYEIQKTYDLVIYGGTSAGVIAAYSAGKMGKSVILIHHGHRLGGLSAGGLGQTDIGNKYAVTGLARNFYRQLGDYYGQFESWKFEPKVALEIFQSYIKKEEVPVIYDHCILSVNKDQNRIHSIEIDRTTVKDRGNPRVIQGKTFLDCSYEGDLLAKAGVSYTIGRESNDEYGETLNGVQLREYHQFPDGVDPYLIRGNPESGLLWGINREVLQPEGTGDHKVQTYNFRICLTNDPDNLLPITRPEGYDSSRYELLIRLIEAQPDNRSLQDYFIWSLMPNHKTDINNKGGFSTDMIGMNFEYPEADWAVRKQIFDDHVSYTKGLLYFLRYDPRVPVEIRKEISSWGYPMDEYLENGNWTPQLYIREARRMIGSYVMTEHHCTGDSVVEDPIALAAYTMDSHNCQRLVVNNSVKNEGDVQIGGFPPYPISYRSLVPLEVECNNLIVPVCLSASHIAFGSIRMEPVFMVLGQASAIAASLSIDQEISIQQVHYEDINRIMETDPLLDGTPPDITVDNEDLNVNYHGEWIQETHFMRNYKNSLMVLNEPTQEDYFRFRIQGDRDSNYKVYFYCPLYDWESTHQKYPGKIKSVINYAGGEKESIVDYAKHIGNWVNLGTYVLKKDQEFSITIRTEDYAKPLIADAVLLVPVND